MTKQTSNTKSQQNYALAVACTIAVFCMGQIPGSIDAAISKITIAFNLSSTSGLYVTTVACIVSVVFSILLGLVAGKKIGFRPLIFFCATVELITALLPFLASNFVVLIILRGLFGIGFGGMQSMENTVAAKLIPANKRAGILGMGMFFGFGANCVLQYVGGLLADIGWNYVFLNHLLLIIPYAIVVVGCLKLDFSGQDEEDAQAVESKSDAELNEATDKEAAMPKTKKAGINRPIVQMWVMMLFVGIFIAPLLVGCSFLSEPINDSAAIAGIVAVFFSVGCMVGGLCYAKLFAVLKKFALPVFLFMMVLGLAGCGMVRTIPLLCAWIFIAGMSFSLTMSMSMMILTLSSAPSMIAMASALMMALYNLGMFLSSSFEELVGLLTGDALYMPLYVGAVILAVFAVCYSLVSPLQEK